jgi:hypothetical protein
MASSTGTINFFQMAKAITAKKQAKQSYDAVLDEILKGARVEGDNGFDYVTRMSVGFTAIAAGNNPSFAFYGTGGAGTFCRLPYKRMIMQKFRSLIIMTTAAGIKQNVSHVMRLLTPAPVLTSLSPGLTGYSVDSQPAIAFNPDAAILPVGVVELARSGEENEAMETPPYVLSETGLALILYPVVGTQNFGYPPPVTFPYGIGDNFSITAEFYFKVIP